MEKRVQFNEENGRNVEYMSSPRRRCLIIPARSAFCWVIGDHRDDRYETPFHPQDPECGNHCCPSVSWPRLSTLAHLSVPSSLPSSCSEQGVLADPSARQIRWLFSPVRLFVSFSCASSAQGNIQERPGTHLLRSWSRFYLHSLFDRKRNQSCLLLPQKWGTPGASSIFCLPGFGRLSTPEETKIPMETGPTILFLQFLRVLSGLACECTAPDFRAYQTREAEDGRRAT